MKKLILTVCAVLTAGIMAAQPPFGGPPPGGFPGGPGGPMGGDRKVDNAKRYEYVKTGLNMDDKTFEKFLPLYMAYQRELRNIDKELKMYIESFTDDEITEKVAVKVAVARLDAQMDMARVKKEHLRTFVPYLTPDQILKVFSLERGRDGRRPPRGGAGAPPQGLPEGFTPPPGMPTPPPGGFPTPPSGAPQAPAAQ